MELSVGFDIWSHYSVSCCSVAGFAGDDYIAPVHPHPHVLTRHKEGITVMAVLATEFPVDPDPLPHGDLPCEFHVSVAQFRVRGVDEPGLPEEHPDTFPGNLFAGRVLGSHLHATITGIFVCILSVSRV